VAGAAYDVAIIGGGIVGCAVARDAAGRGLSVYLCEQGDLAGSASSNTGRILADPANAFALFAPSQRRVRAEQDVLIRNAPHLVRPLHLLMPLPTGPRTQIRRLGAVLAGRIGGAGGSSAIRDVDLPSDPAGGELRPDVPIGQEIATAVVDDARLAILNAADARARGAQIEPRTRCIQARREGWFWKLTLESTVTGERWKVAARCLVNATGAAVGDVLRTVVGSDAVPDLRLVKRTWMIVRRRFRGDRAYAFAGRDGRTVLAIPYERDFTLIGPREAGHAGDPTTAHATIDDVEALLDTVNRYLAVPLTREAVAWTYVGVCALPAARRRSASIGGVTPDMPPDLAPLVSVVGAEMATHRLLAERILEAFTEYVEIGKAWTATAPLPGGHFPIDGAADLVRALRAAYPFIAEIDAERMVNAYGTRAVSILSGARRIEDLGRQFGGLSEAELRYLVQEEWALTATDVLWRRSKLGLRLGKSDLAALDQWMSGARSPAAAPAA
jgi:glycerol-3-phosphate dehydrogenase